jgi:tRNA modification GTPase
VATRLAIDGWPVELLDTAGLRPDADGLEQAGIDIARGVIESADLCLWVVDAENPVWPEPLATPMFVVLNKSDLLTAALDDDRIEVRVSAKTGEGIGSLLGGISRKIVADPPPGGAAVPILKRQLERIREIRTGIEANDKAAVERAFAGLGTSSQSRKIGLRDRVGACGNE